MRIQNIFIACFAVFLLTPCLAYGYEDGFAAARKVEGQYFSIFYAAGVDESELIRKLNITETDKILAGIDAQEDLSGLAGMLDVLFLRVSGILDIPLYSFKGQIKICKDYPQLERIYGVLFSESLRGELSFYVPELNTIYIYTDSFTREILGHEIAHALLNRYFVVQPPMKTQEILSGYVEYQLRKAVK